MKRGVAAVSFGVMLAVGMAGVAGAKEVANEKYAKKLCGAVNGVLSDIEGLDSPTTEDPATYQTQALAALDEIIASMQQATTKLKKLSPEDGGKRVTKLFDTYLKDFTAEFQSARDDFAAADPSSPAFSADVAVLGTNLQTATLGLDDPFSELSDNQDLLGAFDDEKSCAEIVTVYGV